MKVGIFEGHVLKEKLIVKDQAALDAFLQGKNIDHILVSSVGIPAEEILSALNTVGQKIKLTAALPLPFKNLYATPATLGVDRIAAVAGALEIFPDRNCLVIDAGTCINYEFIDDQAQYHGGAISPGVHMRLEAMHKFTARLPLVEHNPNAPLTGDSTETCMQSGVTNGVISEIEGVIDRYSQKHSNLGIILCGGDHALFENKLKPSIFVAPELVLMGLNRILLHNVRN